MRVLYMEELFSARKALRGNGLKNITPEKSWQRATNGGANVQRSRSSAGSQWNVHVLYNLVKI